MSVPGKRRSSSCKGRRRSHHALEAKILKKCPQCGKAVLPHVACAFCGTYKGKPTIKIKVKKTKSEK